jgi:hypothetical protein
MLLLVKVLIKLLAISEQFDEYLGPPLPPETLGFPRIEGATAEPDYPPSTCCVRVVRFGCWWSNLDGQMIRGQGRASLGSDVQWWRFSDEKTERNR